MKNKTLIKLMLVDLSIIAIIIGLAIIYSSEIFFAIGAAALLLCFGSYFILRMIFVITDDPIEDDAMGYYHNPSGWRLDGNDGVANAEYYKRGATSKHLSDEEVISDWFGLLVAQAGKYETNINKNEDFMTIASIALLKAYRTWKPEVSAFSTYAAVVIRNKCIDQCKMDKKSQDADNSVRSFYNTFMQSLGRKKCTLNIDDY